MRATEPYPQMIPPCSTRRSRLFCCNDHPLAAVTSQYLGKLQPLIFSTSIQHVPSRAADRRHLVRVPIPRTGTAAGPTSKQRESDMQASPNPQRRR